MTLTNIWKDKNISLETKKRLLNTLVFSIANFGSECWVLKNSERKRINSFELWCYRRLLRISWTEKKTKDEVLQKIRCNRRLLDTLNTRKLTFLGHVLRSTSFDKTLLMDMVFGPRGRVRPKARYSNDLKNLCDMTMVEATRLAQNRGHWRSIVWRATAGRIRTTR